MLSRRLLELRKTKKRTQDEVASFLGVTRPAYSGYESGRRQPDYDTLIKMAQYFGVSIDYMLGNPEARTCEAQATQCTYTPVLGPLRRADFILAEENISGYTAVPAGTICDFAVRIQGDAMSWVGVIDGDVGLFGQTSSPRLGSVVAALHPDSPCPIVRFYLEQDGGAIFRAGNPAFKDIRANEGTRVIGELVAVIKHPPTLEHYSNFVNLRESHDRAWQEVMEMAAQAGIDGQTASNVIAAFIQLAQKISEN